ncbi:YchF/TatD family DNA exonuclease [Gordonia pseudamarae]|uniref:YchF/TatD family DNA exonuclease n=1 Tax=Gordonia pseudamarae TaxID=2831662 RepID=A0ABX6IHA4_9ACTN|nr:MULTISPECIES: TatD family hydrolase [Gordonia]MBD0023369.1 TatD family hydrolase [Gordonia sp. (in: high G+C Gram-positive bacteria)]QHN25594.1 YchF/TatD family DNA exonuclease [Gordonia pseudamarae]QHN34526.1 YchF/TatD family DNA exonuclease [Gordonia pseudamarae]
MSVSEAPTETESNKAARRRLRKQPPPDPTPLAGLIDAHTHLAACGGRDPESVRSIVDHAASVGVAAVVTVADDIVDARWAHRAAQWDERVYAAVAIHPTHAGELDDATRAEIETMAADDRVVAVGETGLDYYWIGKSESCATREQQYEAFAWHIDLAKRLGKPLMIHNRDADADLLDVLAAEGAPEAVIMHCFSGDRNVARECVDRGYLLSFSGTVTFANSTELRAAAELVPDDQLLVETDAPFLTPHPYRGQPNQSYCLPYTARHIARTRDVDEVELAAIVGANARRVYNIPLR